MRYALPALALLLGFLALTRISLSPVPYRNDEADYMYAACLGLAANYTDTPAVSLPEFFRLGLSLGQDPSQQIPLSERIRASDDVRFYRHWHGPLYYYWLIGTAPWRADEYLTRALCRVFPVITFLVIYLGCLWLFPQPRGAIAAVLAATLYLWSYATVQPTEIAPHFLFVVCYTTSLFLCAKLLLTGRRRYWYAALVTTGLAFCTMEVTFVLVLTLLICGYRERKRLRPDIKLVLCSAGCFVGTVLATWPGALLKLSFVNAYVFMAYLALQRKAPWGPVSLADTWLLYLSRSPLEWLLFGSAVVVYFGSRGLRDRGAALPFLIFGALMVLAVARVTTDTTRYMSPFFPAMQVFAGLVWSAPLARLRPLVRYGLATLVGLLLLGNTYRQLPATSPAGVSRNAAVLAYIRAHDLQDQKLLVPQDDVPLLHYYFPKVQLHGYVDEAHVPENLARDHFRGVLYTGDALRFEWVGEPRP